MALTGRGDKRGKSPRSKEGGGRARFTEKKKNRDQRTGKILFQGHCTVKTNCVETKEDGLRDVQGGKRHAETQRMKTVGSEVGKTSNFWKREGRFPRPEELEGCIPGTKKKPSEKRRGMGMGSRGERGKNRGKENQPSMACERKKKRESRRISVKKKGGARSILGRKKKKYEPKNAVDEGTLKRSIFFREKGKKKIKGSWQGGNPFEERTGRKGTSALAREMEESLKRIADKKEKERTRRRSPEKQEEQTCTLSRSRRLPTGRVTKATVHTFRTVGKKRKEI